MANSLYQALLDKIRHITKPRAPYIPRPYKPTEPAGSTVVPFAPGRVYKCVYTNYKNDPRPLLFILYSDAFYTHGINVNYLGGMQRTMMQMILYMRKSNKPLTGSIMYEFLKMRAPGIPELAYRMYFTRYLRGKLVSDGVSQMPSPNKAEFLMGPFVRQLNNLIRPDVVNKVRLTQEESDRLVSEMDQATTQSDLKVLQRRGIQQGGEQ